MIRVDIDVSDLAQTRFGFSPLTETIGALRVLRDPARHAVHQPWVRWAQARLHDGGGLDTQLIDELVIEPPSFSEFLMPAPDSRADTLELELERLMRTSARHVRARIDRPKSVLRAYATELRAAHELLVAPFWPRLQALLDADVIFRSRQLADRGAAAMFEGIDPRVRWHDDGITVDDGGRPGVARVASGGLVLQPSAFLWPDIWVKPSSITFTTVRYPARGLGTLWAPDESTTAPALEALLGAPRARLITLLASPATTGDLATRLRVTPSAVSQHVRVLREAGLVASEAVGRSRVHALTATGRALAARDGP